MRPTRLAAWAVWLALLAAQGRADASEPTLFEALRELQRRGLRLVFSSDLVTPELRLRTPARPGATMEKQAEEWLRPHGLRLERGPRDSLLVVRARRPAGPSGAPAPAKPSLRLRLSTPAGHGALTGVPVTLNGRALEAALGADGGLALGEIDPGAYIVDARTRDLSGTSQVRLDTGGLRELDVALVARPRVELDEAIAGLAVTVAPAAELSEAIQVRAGVVLFDHGAAAVRVHPGDLGRLTGAAENAVRAAHALPGVIAFGQNDARFIVRGGEPDQNLVVLDGVEVHNPFPFTRVVNPFDAAVLERFELQTGPLPARYGDRLSSALVLDLRPGTFERRLAGTVGLGLLEGDAVLEGRLPGGERASWLVSARGFNYRLISEALSLEPADGRPPAAADLQAKLAFEPGPGRRLTLYALRARDVTTAGTPDEAAQDLFSARWRAARSAGSYWTLQLSAYRTRDADRHAVALAAPGERLQSDGIDGESEDHALELSDLSASGEVARVVGAHTLSLGARVQRLRSRLDWLAPWYLVAAYAPELAAQDPGQRATLRSRWDRSRAALWFEDHWSLGRRLAFTAGLRLARGGARERLPLDPSLAAVFAVDARTRIRLAASRQRQAPGFEKLIQRVSPVSPSGDLPAIVDPQALRGLRSERESQVEVAAERLLRHGLGLRVAAYIRDFDGLLYARPESEAERLARLARYDFPVELQAELPLGALPTRRAADDGGGRVWGLEATLTRPAESVDQRLSGWVAYAWTHSTRDYGLIKSVAAHERRHALSAAMHVGLGVRWHLACTGWLASGEHTFGPATLGAAGVLDAADADQDGRTDELLPRFDAWGEPLRLPRLPAFSEGRRLRLPALARADVRATFEPRGPGGRWSFYLEVVNVLDRQTPAALWNQVSFDPAFGRRVLRTQSLGTLGRFGAFGARFRF